MNVGCDKPIYLLPFDHRHSYVKSLFKLEPPLSAVQAALVSDSKQLIYEGFLSAVEMGVPRAAGGILVDEEFGADVLRDARRRGFVTALSTEASGADEFEFEYGAEFARHIESFDPTFAKALVRYNVEGDEGLNRRQAGRLKQLSDHCRRSQRRFMFELLVPATEAQLVRLDGDKDAYDRDLRPMLMQEAIRALQNAGVEPDVWKVEGLAQRDHCERVVAAARCGGREAVGCIVLGRGADETQVRRWLATAAGVPGFIGFAVGRTTFWYALVGWQAQMLTRAEAVAWIAGRLREWVDEVDPDVVMACAGDVPTLEALAAVTLLRSYVPDIRIRFVNVVDLMVLQLPSEHPHGLADHEFDALFTTDKPVIFAFHGYPAIIHKLTYRRHNHDNIHVRGYKEEGTTTTPFDMVVLNNVDRYQLALDAIRRIPRLAGQVEAETARFEATLQRHKRYIGEHGDDMPEVLDWRWSPVKTDS